ncbi:MAG: CotH kinase family protein, partial [Opitutaceae bacterium]
PPGGYVVIFASSKDRSNPAAPLHTNFALGAGGEYLGLIQPDGTTVASEFAPAFPAQSDNISYGRILTPNGVLETGFLQRPTPGAANGAGDALLLIETVTFSPPASIFSDTIRVELSGAGPGQEIRYVTASGPEGVPAEVTPESPLYTGPLTLTTTTHVRAAVFSVNRMTSGATTQAHFLKRAEDLAGFRSKLPVLVLDNLGTGELVKDGIDHASWMFGYAPAADDPGMGGRAPDVATPLVATVRGSSSADFPKKGYNVKLRDAVGNKRALALFDLPAYERWALIAPWAHDQNFINNSFVYELSNRIGRWAPRTRLTEMFFNTGGDGLDASDYAGIYVVADRIRAEKGRVDIPELSAGDVTAPAVTGGYIVKIDIPDDDEFGWRTNEGVPLPLTAEMIVLVAPDAGDIVPAQREHLQGYIQQMENALHADRASGWSQRTHLDYIDRPSWIDHHILNALVNNPDALYRSAYFTKPRGGKLQAGPVWDFDRALGSLWDERTDVLETWSGIGGHSDLWQSGWWGILAEDPDFMQAWADRWQQLRTTHFSTVALTTLAQTLANTIGIDAADRDAERWPDNASPHGSYDAQIEALKNWLTRRTAWIDSQFVASPTSSTNGGMLTFTAPAGALLAYTLDGTDPRLAGGEVAPNTQMISEALTVPASSNIHVRSYHPGMADRVPGTPWSSVVSGAAASPLVPPARLVNLSSRAIAGSDENALVVGVMVSDTESKACLARGIGPGLAAFGASNTMGEPRVRVLRADGSELERNLGWQNHPSPVQLRNAAQSVGAFQLADGSPDSAVIANLPAGSHLIEIAAANGQPG